MYGIDFGTSNTVVTEGQGKDVRILDLGEGGVLPSLLYFERDRRASVGHEAMSDYAAALERFKGEKNLYSAFRFFQAIKLALKDEYFTGTRIFGELIAPEALAAIFLKEVKRRADAASGRLETKLILGRPVVLSSSPEKDRLLEARFRKAANLAGFEAVDFVMEPVAAMAGMLGSAEGRVLIFDFGGGTLDISVAEIGPSGTRILANDGMDLGGYLLNEDISRSRIIRHFGAGGKFRTMTGRYLDFPAWITKQVASFYALPLADIQATLRTIKDLQYEARREDKPKLLGLTEFLTKNLGFSLFTKIDEAKIALSDESEAVINFSVPGAVAFTERLSRLEFESLVEPRVRAARSLVLATLEKAGLEPASVDRVVRVGGSSKVPIFARMLEEVFPGRVHVGEFFTSIARGLIPAADRGWTAAST